jgi:hypothetical protein
MILCKFSSLCFPFAGDRQPRDNTGKPPESRWRQGACKPCSSNLVPEKTVEKQKVVRDNGPSVSFF